MLSVARVTRLVRISVSIAGIVGIAAALSACSDHPYEPDQPAIDPSAPVVHITSPERGAFASDVQTLLVRGTATDDTAVAGVQVNGVDAVLAADGSWTATIPVTAGTQLIHAIARDASDNLGKESRAVVIGALSPMASAVPHAITAAISAQTFGAIGSGLSGFLTTADLAATVAPLNPVVDYNGGPDCLYGMASITQASLGSATRVSITPQPGGLALDVELDQVAIGVHLAYAVACLDGSRDVTASASHIQVTGVLGLGVKNGGLDIALTGQHVQISGFDVNLGGIPDEIASAIHLDAALGPVVGYAIEKLVVPALGGALAGLDDARTIDVLGTPVDIRIAPSAITVDATGAWIDLATTLRAHGDAAAPGYVAIAGQVPAMTTARGFALAVADDAVNQLLGSYWAAGGMDRSFDLTTGSYGAIGTLYDSVELAAKVPPFVSASRGALALTIGDLVATFKHGGAVATAVAVSAEVDVRVVAGPGGAPRLDVGTPTTYVDVLDEQVTGANVLSNAQFEAIASFALGRVIAVGSGAIGAVPLPAFGGVAVHDLAIDEQTGYLLVDGDVQ